MKKTNILLLLFLLTSITSNAQDFYSVIAKSGLFIRSSPDLSGQKIGKFDAGQDVKLLEDTGKSLTVKDGGQSINGNWFKVEGEDKSTGYVFSGYLLKKINNPWVTIGCENDLPCHSVYSFDDFSATIYNYQSEANKEKQDYRADTLTVYEYVFNEVGDKLLQIIPKKKTEKIKVYYTRIENINEQYDDRKKYTAEQEENMVSWSGSSPFIELENLHNFFRIPVTAYEQQEEFRKQKMQLRDTLIDLSGESMNVATMIYKEKPCVYGIESVLLKVEMHYADQEKEIQYIEISLSYGC